MAQQPLPYGEIPNDPVAANRISNREAWKRTGEMFGEFYAKESRIISAADIRFASQPTTEAKIEAALTQAETELAAIVLIPANMLPYDTTLVGGHTSIKRVREGGDYSHHDILAYGAVGGGHAYDIPSLQAAANTATVVGGLIFVPSTFTLTAATFTGVTGLFTGENVGGVRLLSGHNPTLSSHGNTNYVPGDDTPWGQLHVYSQIMAVGAPSAGGADLMLICPKHRSGGVDYDIHLCAQKVNGVLGNGVVFPDIDFKVSEYFEAPFRPNGEWRIRQGDNSPSMGFPIAGGLVNLYGRLVGNNGANLNLIQRIGNAAGSFIVENAAGNSNLLVLNNSGTMQTVGSVVAGGSVHATQRVRSGAVSVTWSTTPNIDANLGTHYLVNATSNIAAVITASNTPAAGLTQYLTVEIHNSSGGALSTAPTFNTANFLFSAVTNPANGTGVIYQFAWSATRSKWLEMGTHQAAGL